MNSCRVTGKLSLLFIKDHFLLHPLQSTKLIHFKLWSTVLDLMVRKEHLTFDGLAPIVAIKSHLTGG